MIAARIIPALAAIFILAQPALVAVPRWTSPNSYRVLLSVDPRGIVRKNSPASVSIDLPAQLATGTFDKDTIEVVGYDTAGAPRTFDATRPGYEKYLLPWRLTRYYPITNAALSFVMPDDNCTTYAVYFDTVESGRGRPDRYPGLVGDGDFFREGYGRREINANHFDDFCDFDNDGDLDLFRGGVEPFIYCYEDVGGNRYVDRGRMTSGGTEFMLPRSGDNRSWVSLQFDDWDGDSDQDLFAIFNDGPDSGNVVVYRNMRTETGTLSFTRIGQLLTQSGKPLGDGWFATVTPVDWDGDGKNDIISTRENTATFHRNIGSGNSITNIQLADGVYVLADGLPIRQRASRVDCADVDSDGDLDMLVVSQGGPVHWFTNVGTRTNPVFTAGRMIVNTPGGHTGVRWADFDGDGLTDFIYGRLWENSADSETPRNYGRLYKNVGTPTAPRFEATDAYGGAPYTLGFQMCDAVRQNGIRAVDWNNDGKMDLIGSRDDGFVWLFLNTTNSLEPVFAAGTPLISQGKPVRVTSDQGGYARSDIADWNGDDIKDLLVADGGGLLWVYYNQGTDANPVLGSKTQVYAAGAPIDRDWRGSVLVCDWNNDGVRDIVYADQSGYYYYENTGTNVNPILAAGTGITFNNQTVSYTRPNLGSFIDWDIDGKKDFIGCEFENSVRFYRNTASGAPDTTPQFANTNGVTIVRTFSVQMCSGADTRDWNGDGDIDILTGQGHGGSNLRFYERDYINDFVSGKWPIVTQSGSEQGCTIAQAKAMAGGSQVLLPQVVVTGGFNGFFYVENSDRTGGIRVNQANHGRSIGDVVDVYGQLSTASGERCIAASLVMPNP